MQSCRSDLVVRLENIQRLQEYYCNDGQAGGNQKFLRDGSFTATWTNHGPGAPTLFAVGAMPPMSGPASYKNATCLGARNSSVSQQHKMELGRRELQVTLR